MDANELRALADALDRIARTHAMIAPAESETQHQAADYLRACAEAEPVAWRCEVRGDGTDPKLGAGDWRHYHTTTSEREALAFVARCGNGIEGRAVPLYLHPAPAVPAGWKLVPVEPTEAHLASMGMRHRHDYGMLDEKFQDSIRCQMRQLYEEAIGEGFFRIAAPAASQAEPHRNQPLRDLLAVIHCDGGHHTEAVGIEQSIKDALSAVYVLKGKLAEAEPKREPLMALLELAEQSDDCQRGILTTSIVRELVNEALGIGGSDER